MRIPLLTLTIVGLDQWTKQWALSIEGAPWWLFDQSVGFELTRNSNIAFSLPISGFFAIALSLMVLAALVLYCRTHSTSLKRDLVFGLIFGGAISNFLDRIIRGAVIDFIRIGFWPNFNLADSAITIGFLLFILFFATVKE